jgi:hypothetical protein
MYRYLSKFYIGPHLANTHLECYIRPSIDVICMSLLYDSPIEPHIDTILKTLYMVPILVLVILAQTKIPI